MRLNILKILPAAVPILLAASLLIFHCRHTEKAALRRIEGGGIVLTFDDDFVSEWIEADRILKKYNWKATFFVCHFKSLNTEAIRRLDSLQSRGHEIGFHSENHHNAVAFIDSQSVDAYLAVEILPSLAALSENGFHPVSFAYPEGARNKRLDRVLLAYFDMLRGITYKRRIQQKRDYYANGSRLVFGMGLDAVSGNKPEYILSILQYAKDHDKIAVFFGHSIARSAGTLDYATTYETLERICRFVQDNGMHFLTMKELIHNNP